MTMPFTTILKPWKGLSLSLFLVFLSPYLLFAQGGDCPYPIIFLHGWTGDQSSWGDAYSNNSFENIYGELTDDHVFHAMLNAQTNTYIWGNDGTKGTNDDDVLVTFNNENNELAPGCVYAINFDNSWNEDVNNPIINRNDGSAISFTESDSNESAIFKQGYALGVMIDKVLAANPDKSKVILAGHSMGGLAIREYLQRTGSGGHPWWVTPGSGSGHKVASVLTTVTPHRGSNTLGNISGVRDDDNSPQRDGLPDLFSEAVRDLRYSWSCGLFGGSDCSGAYLFGGDEDAGWGWWNEDVNCDGDESDNDIVGVNISGEDQGTGDPWNGTYDNPNMPLPTNIHYTWMTSDIPAFDGDGVVAWDRQWLFNGNVPYPSDGLSGRLTDTLLNNATHLGANDDMNKLIRGMDEGDYPYFAWILDFENPYTVIPTYRARNTPHGNTTADPDWFAFSIPSGFADDLAIDITPGTGVATQVDFFGSSVGDYTDMNQSGPYSAAYPLGTNSEQRLLIPNAALQKDGLNYLRILHTSVNYLDWKNPADVTLTAVAALPLDWLSFTVKSIGESTAELTWSTASEEQLDYYEIQKSEDGKNFQPLDIIPAKNQAAATYHYVDHKADQAVMYYRIRVKEFDESTSYSVIRSLQRQSLEMRVGDVYPNPVRDEVFLPVTFPQEGEVSWIFVNALGQAVDQGIMSVTSGGQVLALPTAHLPVGWYHLSLEKDHQRKSVTLFKQQ